MRTALLVTKDTYTAVHSRVSTVDRGEMIRWGARGGRELAVYFCKSEGLPLERGDANEGVAFISRC
jgi:hypothetical protein